MITILVLVSLPATGLLLLQNKKIQTLLTHYVAREISKKLGTEIKVGKVSVTFFNRLQVRNLYLEDTNGDTLLYADKIKARITHLNRKKEEITIGRLAFDNTYIHLITDTSGVINLRFIIDQLNKPGKEKKQGWKTTFERIEFSNSRFRYTKTGNEAPEYGINFQDMDLGELQIKLAGLNIAGDTLSFDIKDIAFLEKSGFRLNSMNARMSLSKRHMDFGNIYVETPLSNVSANQIRFVFTDYGDFSDFVNRVKTYFNLRSSIVNFADIGYFAPALKGYNQTLRVSGLVTGTISDMSGQNILLSYNDHTSLEGSFNMIGLPDFHQTFMHLNIRQLTTDVGDIRMLSLPGNKKIDVPANFNQLGLITYTGKFTGYMDDFVAYGNFNTRLGKLSSDLLIKPYTDNGLKFKGRLKSQSFNLGNLTRNDKLIGKISMSANVDGFTSRDTLAAGLSGKIDSITFYGYNYRNIDLSGQLNNKKFDGTIHVNDPNLKMDFLGKVDISSSRPNFDFTANVTSVKPYYLNLEKTDPEYFASFLLKTNFSGRNIDDLDGEIKLVNSFFQKSGKQVQIYDLSLIASSSADTNLIRINSDILDGELSGHYQFSTLGKSFKNLAYHYLPSLAQDKLWNPDSVDHNNFRFNVNLKNVNSVVNFFLPDFEIADSSYLAGNYNPAGLEINLIADCPLFGFYGNRWQNLQIITSGDFNKTKIVTRSYSLQLKNNLSLDNLTFNAAIYNDTITLNLDWNSFEKPKYQGKINLMANLAENMVTENPKLNIHMQPSSIIFNDTTWNISKSLVVIDTSSIKVDSFTVSNKNQMFLVSGGISTNPEETLRFMFNDLDLSTLNIFTKKAKLTLNGRMTGKASLKDPLKNPLFLSDLELRNLFVNGEDFGDGEIRALWNNEDKRIHVVADTRKGSAEILKTEGDFYPETKKLDFRIKFDKIRVNTFSPYTDFLISDPKGLGSGDLTLGGTSQKPDLNGKINLFKTSFVVNYLQTRYYFTNDVDVIHNSVYLKNFEVYDELGNKAITEGSIETKYFRDLYLNLRLQTNNFKFLSTTESDNQLFYGNIFASGIIRITGPPDNLQMDINARSQKNSVFYIPLYGSEEVNENDFIKFVNSGSEERKKEEDQNRYEVKLRGLSLNFDLDVTNDAEVQLIFDPKVGDKMRGRGNGNLKININTLGKFEIFGDITIESGDYLFTLQNVINKKFEVEPGGRISWNGDPEDANIDMKAVYALRTPVTPLDPSMFEGSSGKRIPVECVIQLTGKLMNPTIKPDITLPTADQETQRIVRNSTSTEEELMKQFLSLLVLNSFYSNQQSYGSFAGTGGATTAFASAGMATTSEMLSNQLNHWLSQISKDIDIGFNYRPGSEVSRDEYEVALSTQILNDRITINGNVDVGGNQTTQTTTTTNTNNIVGDFDIDVKITENGKVHMKAFNRANDNLLFQTSPYTQGVGVFFREDFNTFGELLRRYKDAIFGIFITDKKKKEKEDTDTTAGSLNASGE